MEITANIPGVGDFTMIADQSTYTGTGDKDIRISVRPGLPIGDDTDPNYGYDQFQRRRTSDFGGPGNNALFVKVPGEGGSRYGVIPTAAGEDVLFNGGGIDPLEFFLIATLSNDKFDASSIFVLTSHVKSISIYSLLGKAVMSKEISGASSIDINTSPLTSGMYIVDFKGEGGNFTKKIIKH